MVSYRFKVLRHHDSKNVRKAVKGMSTESLYNFTRHGKIGRLPLELKKVTGTSRAGMELHLLARNNDFHKIKSTVTGSGDSILVAFTF